MTDELVLKADNLAQVSAAALSINRTGYSVTYDAGSGTGSVPEDPAPYAEGGTVALKDKPADLKKDGWNFSGWGASGGVNIRDNSFTMPGSDVTLQALWGRAYIQKRTNTVTQEPTRRMKNSRSIGYSNAFYASTYKNNILSVTFLNTNEMPAGAVEIWDITDTNFGTAGSVMAAVVANGSDAGKYDLYIGAKGGVEAPVDSSSLFSGFSSLATVNNISYFDTTNVTSMSYMFSECKALTTLDVSGWDTRNVNNMSRMFYKCNGLVTLDVSNWDTSSVTNMSYTFSECKALTTLDVSGWDTSSVTNMSYTFHQCIVLAELNVSKWDTSSVTDMAAVFDSCTKLTKLDMGEWDTSSVTDMGSMFSYCNGLEMLDVSNWDTSNVTNMRYMFHGCTALKGLNLSNWKTGNVTNMNGMFFRCDGLERLDLSNWNTSNVNDMQDMFCSCDNLENLDVSGWETGNVTSMKCMFGSCSRLKTLNVKEWKTGNVTNMERMFESCSALPSIGTDLLSVANGCSITNWNKGASNALTAVTIKAVDGTVLYKGTAAVSLRAADMSALCADGKQTSAVSAEENPSNKPEEKGLSGNNSPLAEEERSSSVHTADGGNATLFSGAQRDSEALYASVKNGVTEGGKLTAGQKVEYELELQYIGDEGGRSGELVVTDNIPAGMTYNGDASVSSV